MKYTFKAITTEGIPRALAKAERYRFLNEPEESESICRDILFADPENQQALRTLGLAITDQFNGSASDRYSEAASTFDRLASAYERAYYAGILHERRAKAQMRSTRPTYATAAWFEQAMKCFEQAEKLREAGNDDALLRWNRCARLLETLPESAQAATAALDTSEGAPVPEEEYIPLPRKRA
jgi:hypothetical protein